MGRTRRRSGKQLVHIILVFREVEDKNILADENGDFNFLLEEDNLHSLKLLEKTRRFILMRC